LLHISCGGGGQKNDQRFLEISNNSEHFFFIFQLQNFSSSSCYLHHCTNTHLQHCVHNSYKRDTHTHTDIALYIYRFLYRYTVLLYTSTTETYTCGAHTMLGSVILLYIINKFVPTNESPSKITLMNRFDQSQIFWHRLNCCMLTTSFPKGNGRGKKVNYLLCILFI
jgi:hypothetical protein